MLKALYSCSISKVEVGAGRKKDERNHQTELESRGFMFMYNGVENLLIA
jgi:hypothetical protein